MGLGGISPWSLLIILIIVLLLFGTKRLRNMGSDLGETFKNFKKAMKEGEDDTTTPQDQMTHKDSGRVIDSEAKEKDKV